MEKRLSTYGVKRSGVEGREKMLWGLGAPFHHWCDRKAAKHTEPVQSAPMREWWKAEK